MGDVELFDDIKDPKDIYFSVNNMKVYGKDVEGTEGKYFKDNQNDFIQRIKEVAEGDILWKHFKKTADTE